MNINPDVPPSHDAEPTGNDELRSPRPRGSAALVLLATFATLATLWATRELLLPIVLALFFALVANPLVRALQRLWIPRFLGALLLVAGAIIGTVALGNQLIEPAGEWVRQVPREMRSLAPKVRELIKPVHEANRAAQNIARAAGGESAKPAEVVKTEVNEPYRALTNTPKVVASVLAVVLLTYFFLVFGERLLNNAVALFPSWRQKKLTMEILQEIEAEISRYVLTISVINILFGLALAAALYALRVPVEEALLWGTMAALLNFAPYIGPLIGMLVMLVMGFVAFDEIWRALLPAGIYLALHGLEGQIITPLVLGRRMSLSPLLLIVALMVFGWFWGIIGLLLAVPLLVCVKLVLRRVGLEGWARLLE